MSYGMFKKEQLYTMNNVRKTSSLILETCKHGETPLFTVSEVREDYLSITKLYLSFCVKDPTEVTFAEAVFGSYSFWKHMTESPKIKPYVEEWRRIAEVKRKQMAFEAIVKEIEDEGRSSFQAAKYLIEEPWKGKTKEAKDQKNETTKEASFSVSQDVKRLKEKGLIQ